MSLLLAIVLLPFQHLSCITLLCGECPFNRTCETLFTLRVARPWRRLPGAAVAAPSLAGFKARLDGALSILSSGRVPARGRGVGTG